MGNCHHYDYLLGTPPECPYTFPLSRLYFLLTVPVNIWCQELELIAKCFSEAGDE